MTGWRARGRAGALMVTVLLLTGCGFHLRSWDVASGVDSAYVVSNPRNPLEEPLRRALRQAGVAEAPSAQQAALVVELLDARQERRSVSVSEQARAAEYEMILAVQYRVTDSAGNELVAPVWLQRESVYRVNRDNLVGSSEEQSLLEQELRDSLVQQMLRTLNSVVAQAGHAAQTG